MRARSRSATIAVSDYYGIGFAPLYQVRAADHGTKIDGHRRRFRNVGVFVRFGQLGSPFSFTLAYGPAGNKTRVGGSPLITGPFG